MKWLKVSKADEPKVATIAMVHKDFDTAEDRILKKVHKILNAKVNEDKVDSLELLGFTGSKGYLDGAKKLKKKRDIKVSSELIDKVKQYFPEYKIITRMELNSICTKYGLVFTESQHFIGEIPTENINDMMEFGDRYITKRQKAMVDGASSTMPKCHLAGEKINFTVVATPDLINIKEGHLVLEGNEYVLPDPDPVVLARFHMPGELSIRESKKNDVFLIVTKWGDEAEIGEFHNQEEN